MPKDNIGKKKYHQKYTKTWEADPELKNWLAPDVTDDTLAICKYCHTTLKAHKKDLISHSKTEKHKKALALEKLTKSCKSLTVTYKPVLSDVTKIAELKIAAYIAEHSAIKAVDHLIEILPQLDSSSDVLKSLKLHRTKCSMLIKNVLGPCMLEDLIEEIGNFPYSLIIDESTDLSTQKVLCIMVRFFSFKTKKIVTTFYRIIKLIECDARSVYQVLTDQLKKDGIKVENMVGIGVDGANVMVGKHNSVTTILKRDLTDLIIVKCVSHSLHLCAEKAAESLPRQLEYLVRETHNWFTYSPKRLEHYRNLFGAINANSNPKKIQGLSGTRWLARYEAITTILDQWDELKLLFSISKTDDKCYLAEQLYDIMKRLPFKAFLIFLKNELKSVIQLNLLFQSDNIEPTKLFGDLFLLYKNLLKRLVVPAQLEKVVDCDLVEFNFQDHLMHTTSIYFGYDFQCISHELEEKDLLDVKERCKNFLCHLTEQIQIRLPDNLTILKMIANLHPKVATSQVKPDIKKILNYIQRVHIYGNKNDIESEWHQLSNKRWSNTANSVEFYSEVYSQTPLRRQRKKYTSHTISVNLNAIREFEEGAVTQEEIANNLKVDLSTVSKWIKNKNDLKKLNEKFISIPKQRKRLSTPFYYRLDRVMWLWFSQKRSTGVPLCGAVIKHKAKQFYKELGGIEKFTASNGWLRCWQKRYDIRSVTVSGEKLSANIDAVEPFKIQFLDYIRSNNLTIDQVFNCDETGLNYKLLPNTTYSAISEESPSGLKGYKDRLTVMACSNVSGSFKLPLTVIGKFAKPRALKNVALPVFYKSQRSAWMTNDLFTKWFDDDFVPAVLSFLNAQGLPPKALLVMDNCAAHKKIHSKNGIGVMCFPPNTTSLIQPMDQGCLQNLKILYKEKLMTFIVEKIDEGLSLTEVIKKVTIKEGIMWAAEAWKNVSLKTIQNSWNKVWPREERTIGGSNIEESRNLEAVIGLFVNILRNHPLYQYISEQQINKWLYPQFSRTENECLSDSKIVQEVMDEIAQPDIQCDINKTEEINEQSSVETENFSENSNDVFSPLISKHDIDLFLKYTKDYCSNNNYPQEIIQQLNNIKDIIKNYKPQEE